MQICDSFRPFAVTTPGETINANRKIKQFAKCKPGVAQRLKLIQTHAPATTVTGPHYQSRIPLLRLRAHCGALEGFLLSDEFGRQKRHSLHHCCANNFNNGIASWFSLIRPYGKVLRPPLSGMSDVKPNTLPQNKLSVTGYDFLRSFRSRSGFSPLSFQPLSFWFSGPDECFPNNTWFKFSWNGLGDGMHWIWPMW